MRELLKRLCACSGLSSREGEVRQLIRGEAAPWADEIRSDALGNLIVHKRGASGISVLLDAHMDETGVMVSGFTDSGALHFQTVGPLDRRTLPGKRVWLGRERIPGVFGIKPIHLTKKAERSTVPATKELYIDIGARDRAQARALVPLGTGGVFSGEAFGFGTDRWKGKALDSRIGCAVLLTLLREPLPLNCTFVFAAQELVGPRGAFGAAFSERPELVLCLDAAPAMDHPMLPEGQRGCIPGEGVVLPVSDRRCQYDRALFEQLRTLAQREKIPWQLQASAPVRSDAGIYQRVRAGCRVAGLSVPVRDLYAPTGMVSLRDAEAMLRLTRAFLRALAREEIR